MRGHECGSDRWLCRYAQRRRFDSRRNEQQADQVAGSRAYASGQNRKPSNKHTDHEALPRAFDSVYRYFGELSSFRHVARHDDDDERA